MGSSAAASGYAFPIGIEGGARTLRTALGPAVREHRGIHGAGRSPGYGVDLEIGLFQQPVQYAQVKAPWEPPP